MRARPLPLPDGSAGAEAQPDEEPQEGVRAVVKRMGSFFTPGNYTNVRGLHVFGY